MRLRVSAILTCLTLTVLGAGAQQPTPAEQPPRTQLPPGAQLDTPIFRATVDVIELDAFVVDAQGNPVTDLTVNDFEILEEGQPREITAFAVVNIPVETIVRPVVSTIVPDVRTNAQPEGRIYLFAVDEIPGRLVPRLRLRLREFVERNFGEHDTAAIVYVGRGRSTDGQDFTSDRAALLRSIDRLSAGFGRGDLETPPVRMAGVSPSVQIAIEAQVSASGLTGAAASSLRATLTDAALSAAQTDSAVNGLIDGEADFLLRSRMLSLRTLTEFMAGMHGRRKSIIYVTTGVGASVYEALDYAGGIRSIAIEDLHAAITAATRGNVSIYPLDPTGVVPGRDVTEEGVADPDNTIPEPSQTSIGRMQDLRGLAETTGGFAIVDTNNFADAFSRVVRDNSSYYVLGFSTSTPRTDGRFHKVQIRVKRPGLEVRSRGGYLAPMHRKTPIITRASTLAPSITEALQSPIGVSGVPIRLFAAPYKASDQQARVAIAAEFGVEALSLSQRQGRLVGDLAVALRPTTAEGKNVVGQRHELSLALKPETYELAKTHGVRVVTEMSLAPGRYQLRVAGGPTVGGAGSVTYDLEIPNYAKERLTMSGVALTSSTAKDGVTIWPASARPLDTKLPGPITASRTFRPGETVTLYTEVYETGRRSAHSVDFKVDLQSGSGRVLSTFTAKRSSTDASGGVYGFAAPIKLDGVEPGAYVLRVAATSSAASRNPVTKDIPITVR
jgi:VWFA-related protein